MWLNLKILNTELNVPLESLEKKKVQTREYLEFKKELMPAHFNIYEKLCNISEKVLKISPDKKKVPALEESINVCHLNVTPRGTASFAFFAPILVMLIGTMITWVLFNSIFYVGFFLVFGVMTIHGFSSNSRRR